ncbi:FtsH protease activity modulator HflK [Anaerocolumna aminovalerica]|jgi:membrane protease subunit HflK|uniref:Protein HflK n=1 Tax=Anaerocolumna aminovalerica TaxID=1527 RepID=A0A1I5EVA3_9FIRM|nr:FtsH protease activity modulator HflK [Anaerocolumna aminovalerica]MDU6265883.1 FtsH protease activity modulator HflK [Anaerocolumna aminovalerica]SFO15343.1 protease FtsH subunit HflK [Anaerocolumna aminovalerica]
MNMYEDFKNKARKPLKHIGLILLVIVAILMSFSSAYTINEQEQAVLTTFGVAKTVAEPGLHFKIPFIQKVQKVNTTINGFSIGYDTASNETTEEEAVMITSDFNFVDVDFFVEYKVIDPVKAVYASQEPVSILNNLAQSCIRTVIGSYDVDSVLTTGKNEIQSVIKEKILEQLDFYDIGIQLISITIQDSEPPTKEVMESFKAVETAKQDKETAINNANKYRNEKLPAAEAEVDKIIKSAEAQKEERINEANGQVARFNSMYKEYKKNPVITKERMFYEAMEEVLPELEVIIDGTDGIDKVLPIKSFFEVKNNETSTDTDTNSKKGDE